MSPWCRTRCPSPATWSETQRTRTRFCVTPGAGTHLSTETCHVNVLLVLCLKHRFVPHPRKMPEDQYVVRVTVSGVPIPDSKICNGYYKSYYCSLYVSLTREAPYCRCVCRSWFMSLKLFSGGLVPHTDHLLPESSLWPPRYHLSACRALPGSSLNPFYKTVCQMSCRLAGLNPRTDLHRRVRKQHAAELQRPQRPVSEVRACSPTFVNVKTQELS